MSENQRLIEPHPLYTAEFDINQKNTEQMEFAVCFHFVPRSGSNFLSDLLFQTKTLGVPLEYFSKNNFEYLMGRLGSFENLIKARLSENGCFSFKWNSNFENIPLAVQAYERISPTYHVFIDRRDKLRQAASYARAIKTQQWFQTARTKTKNVAVSEEEINAAHSILDLVRHSTIQGIEKNRSDYLTIMFEDLIENPKSCLENIYRHCGVEKPDEFPEDAIVLKPSSVATS